MAGFRGIGAETLKVSGGLNLSVCVDGRAERHWEPGKVAEKKRDLEEMPISHVSETHRSKRQDCNLIGGSRVPGETEGVPCSSSRFGGRVTGDRWQVEGRDAVDGG